MPGPMLVSEVLPKPEPLAHGVLLLKRGSSSRIWRETNDLFRRGVVFLPDRSTIKVYAIGVEVYMMMPQQKAIAVRF